LWKKQPIALDMEKKAKKANHRILWGNKSDKRYISSSVITFMDRQKTESMAKEYCRSPHFVLSSELAPPPVPPLPPTDNIKED
jgi:hypothetical protein